jgi:hypothetical protein
MDERQCPVSGVGSIFSSAINSTAQFSRIISWLALALASTSYFQGKISFVGSIFAFNIPCLIMTSIQNAI